MARAPAITLAFSETFHNTEMSRIVEYMSRTGQDSVRVLQPFLGQLLTPHLPERAPGPEPTARTRRGLHRHPESDARVDPDGTQQRAT